MLDMDYTSELQFWIIPVLPMLNGITSLFFSMNFSGHFSQRQAKVKRVKIQNPAWGLVLSLKSFHWIPVMSWEISYSHLFNKRGGWNKRAGGAKVAKSIINLDVGILQL
jgi:hypothetical protein